MSSMQDMIKRFRSEKPMPREARDEMRKQGKIREPWWVDNKPTGGARTVDPDDDHTGRPVIRRVTGGTKASRSPVRSSPSPPRQRFVRYKEEDMDDYADVGAGGGRGAKRRVTATSHKLRTAGADDDDHAPGLWEGRQHKPKAAHADHDHRTSSIDAFLAEDLRKLESTWRPAPIYRTNPHETSGQVGNEEESWRYQDDRDAASLRYRFSPSREVNTTGRGNNYDFVSRGFGSLDRQIADYLRPLSPPAASVESILRQAALRSTLGDPVRKDADGGGGNASAAKEAKGSTGKNAKGEGPEPAKDMYGDLDKFASTLDVTQGLEQTMSRLAQSFQVDRSAMLAEAALQTNAAPEAKDEVRQGVPVLPSSIAQVADDLELSLLPFNNFYKNKERVEKSIEETLKKERDAEMKKMEDRVRYEARLEALDYVAMRWDEAEDEQGSKDGSDGDVRQEALLDPEPGWVEEDGSSLLTGQSGYASHAADIARQMAEVAAKVAAKVKLIQRIENGDLQLPASPPRAPPATDKTSLSPKQATTSPRPLSPKPTSPPERPVSDAQQGQPASSSKDDRGDATTPPIPTSQPQAKTSPQPSSVSTSETEQPSKATTAAPSDAPNVPRIAGPAKMMGDTPLSPNDQSVKPLSPESNDARGGGKGGAGSTEGPHRHDDGVNSTSPSGPAGGGGMRTTDSSSDDLTSGSSGFSKLRRRLVGGDEKNEGRPPMWSAALPDKTGPAGGVTEDLLGQRLKRLMTAKRKKPSNTRNKDNKPEEEELTQATELEGDYGEFTLQETSKGIVSNLEISMMCMMKRLGCDPEQDSKKEKEKADNEKNAKDAEEKRAKQEAELAQWLELKGDELALVLQRQNDKPQLAGMNDKGQPISPRERGAEKENKKPSSTPMGSKDDGEGGKVGSTSKPKASPLKESDHEQHHTAKSPANDGDDILDSLLESVLDDVCSSRSSNRPFSPPDHWKSLYESSASPTKRRMRERGAPWERVQAGEFKSSSLPTSPVSLRRRHGDNKSLLPLPGPAVAALYGPYGYGDPTEYAHGHRYGGRPAHSVSIAQARAQLEEYRHMRFRQRLHEDSVPHVAQSASSHPAPGAARSPPPLSAVEGGGRAYTASPTSQTAAPRPAYSRSTPRPYHHSQSPSHPGHPRPHPPSTRVNHALPSPSLSVLTANGLFEARQRLEEFRAIRQQLTKVVSG